MAIIKLRRFFLKIKFRKRGIMKLLHLGFLIFAITNLFANLNDDLILAVKNGDEALVEILIDQVADINFKEKLNGYTLLHFGAEIGDLSIVELLVENGADVNAISSQKNTPLHLSAERGHLPVVEFLVDHGAEIDAVDNVGRTPLMYAVLSERLSLVRFLVDR